MQEQPNIYESGICQHMYKSLFDPHFVWLLLWDMLCGVELATSCRALASACSLRVSVYVVLLSVCLGIWGRYHAHPML